MDDYHALPDKTAHTQLLVRALAEHQSWHKLRSIKAHMYVCDFERLSSPFAAAVMLDVVLHRVLHIGSSSSMVVSQTQTRFALLSLQTNICATDLHCR